MYSWIIWIIIFIILVTICWWVLSGYDFFRPSGRPDANFRAIINEFNSYPRELWYRNNPCVFDKFLKGSCRRFIIYESDGAIVYDSHINSTPSAVELRNSVEYIRACVTLQGRVVRTVPTKKGLANTANLAVAVTEGERYRIVHVSEYIFGPADPEF